MTMLLLSATPFLPAAWSVIPFILLLLLIATGPILLQSFWHKYYRHISVSLGLLIAVYYMAAGHDTATPAHTLSEYISFILLLVALYVISGGIYIHADFKSTPWLNATMLFTGAVLANLIGTTGASMLLIRPFIRLNKYCIRPYHIVFFIFIVSNTGGLLTPVGDPPLFIGFLKGIPFLWPLENLYAPWLLTNVLLCIVFYLIDKSNKTKEEEIEASGEIVVEGKRNIIWLALLLGSIFLDPNLIPSLPHISLHGSKISFIREGVQLMIAVTCYLCANKTALNGNQFTFAPILEVVFIFLGIFFTMMPALQHVSAYAANPSSGLEMTPGMLYFSAGSLSSFLDNAPTYLNFLTAALAKFGLSVDNPAQVTLFATGGVDTGTSVGSIRMLEAVSAGAVLFGAMTYIGNGPNFMVRSIAEETGIKMPSFFAYIFRYSLPILLPVLLLVWLLFFW